MKPTAALWRFALSGTAAILLGILVANIMTQPVASETRPYTAEFTDASGLHLDADVRVYGVRVGKVNSITLERRAGQSLAAVGFTLDKRYAIGPKTRLAIKFQALTGMRYVDVVKPAEGPDRTAHLVARVPTTMTQPSFDITTLFNGLQPVLATLSPEEINTFTANAAIVMGGDGSGLGAMLDSIRKLTDFVADRQRVVATLMRNLSTLAENVGGSAKQLIQVLEWANRPVDTVLGILDEFRKSALYGADFNGAVARMLHNMGIKPGISIDDALDRAITVLDDNIDTFKRIPVLWESIGPPSAPDQPLPCSRGRAELPPNMDVLLNGQKVILCNQ